MDDWTTDIDLTMAGRKYENLTSQTQRGEGMKSFPSFNRETIATRDITELFHLLGVFHQKRIVWFLDPLLIMSLLPQGPCAIVQLFRVQLRIQVRDTYPPSYGTTGSMF